MFSARWNNSWMNSIQPEDVGLALEQSSKGASLGWRAVTMFLFLIQLDFYRMAVRDGGDTRLSEPSWTRNYKAMDFAVQPINGRLFYSHVFFACDWIAMAMSGRIAVVPEADRGFTERNYLILSIPQQMQEVGYLKLRKSGTT